MKRIKLALNQRVPGPSGTELYANEIQMALTNNINFPGAAAYLPALASGTTELRNALTAAHPGKATIQKWMIYVQKVLNALKGIAELECGEDEEKALSSGFTLKQAGVHKTKTFRATQGADTGMVDLECPYAGRQVAYVWEMSTDAAAATGWTQFKITNTTGTQISGLTPGVKYWFRVKAIVQDEDQPYADPHMVHVV